MIDARVNINPYELRLGNWVEDEDDSHLQFQVDHIEQGKDLVSDLVFINGRHHLAILPIPLTPEILEKAGFKKLNGRGKTGCYRMGDVKINIDNISIAYIKTPNGRFMELVRFKYVHQLQNIVHALTNQEIKI